MSSYVNLLNENEIHYHSAARDSNLIRYLVIGGVAAAILLGLTTVIRYNGAKNKASSLAARWKTLEGEFESTLAKKKLLTTRSDTLNELKGWPVARVDMAEVMELLRDKIPERIQLTKLSILSHIEGIDAASRSNRNAPARKITHPERIYILRIEGTVVDEEGEQIVLDRLVPSLEDDPELKNYFSKVVYNGFTPTTATDHATGKPASAGKFKIQIDFIPREVQWTGKN
ncbi:MAG: hypothetical protein VCG02_14160 [Verrucomicrobiota bacterium]